MSKEDARKGLLGALPKGEAASAQADRILAPIYVGPAALSEYTVFALFRACAAQPPK